MSGKSLVLELNVKVLLANQIAGFFNFNISKTIGGINLIFCIQVHTYLKLQINDVVLGGRGQACPGMPKEVIKTLRSPKPKEVKSLFCA